VKAWLALGRFRPGAPFRPWLVRIAVNEARNQRRGARRRAGLALRLCPDPAKPGAAPSAETEAQAADERARLAAAVGQLRQDDQLVIAARYLLGLSETETAIALGVRLGTVKSRLSRALDRLRAHLEEVT
jgi:RNA polymerase sigma-70 factor (ECF subfamily)